MSEELDDLIDGDSSNQPTEVPQNVKTLGILSIVGNSIWMLLIAISLIYVWLFSSTMGGIGGGVFARFAGAIAGIILLMLILQIIALMGAVKLMNGKKTAFLLYAIPTGLWGLLLVFSGLNAMNAVNNGNAMFTLFSGLVSIGFIIGFGTNLKKMPD